MAQVSDLVSPACQLQLAVHATRPTRLARTFATYAGQFYDRAAFDAMARQAHNLYAIECPDAARVFRTQLDRRLCDRYHDPVTWDAIPSVEDDAI
jgi:hypothetical protein